MSHLAPLVSLSNTGGYVSPWVDATQDAEGNWHLPEYPCEITNLSEDDPKKRRWRPGDFQPGVDNVDSEPQTNAVREWAGQRMWEGERPPKNWDPRALPDNVQALLSVPHMPGQPVKEMYARMKALDPRPFEDRYFEDIWRDLPETWPALCRQAAHAERFGVHTEQAPGEWAGQEEELVPAAYPTPRPDTVTVCVGVTGVLMKERPENEGAEYDFLELLYAKDQEGKVIQIVPFESPGMTPATFYTYSFVPPKGTTSITPFASFKFRGTWRGTAIVWDPTVGSDEMQWFTAMPPEVRQALCDKGTLQGRNKEEVEGLRFAKSKKPEPVLWPENSWEGNAAKARMWDELNR